MTVKRKADRIAMAHAVAELVGRYQGFTTTVELDHLPTIYKRCSTVGIKGPRGVTVGVQFNADSGNGDCFVCTWNAPIRGGTISFSKRFAERDMVRHCNPFGAISKVTRVWDGFHTLMQYLDFDLESIADGTAFDDALAAKYDGHVERGEMPWQQYREGESNAKP